MITEFLITYTNAKVLLLERSGNDDFSSIIKINHNRKIHMIGKEKIVEPAYYKDLGYSFCVIDYGTSWRAEEYHFLQCDLKVFIGGGAIWQQKDWKIIKNWLKEKEINTKSFRFLMNLYNDPKCSLKNELSVKIYGIGYEPDLFQPSLKTVNILKEVLFCCIV